MKYIASILAGLFLLVAVPIFAIVLSLITLLWTLSWTETKDTWEMCVSNNNWKSAFTMFNK